MFLNYVFNNSDPCDTINDVLKTYYNMSNRLCVKLIKNEYISLNSKKCDTRTHLKDGDVVTINLGYFENNSNIVSTKMNLNIIYEDEWFLILNKPAGVAIHPSRLHFDNSLSNGVKFYFDLINLNKKIRPVNRLDLNTSGLVMFAKCEYVQEQLIGQMKNNIFQKEYLCITEGHFYTNNKGIVNLPIGRKSGSIIERCVNENGQPSITYYKVLSSFKNYSLVKCSLKTGRTHQIRVHMNAIGHPLLGDSLYGNSSSLIARQALHSYKIKFAHPITNRTMQFTCELPSDMKKLL